MATPSRHAAVPLSLSQKLRRDPQAFELLQALLLLEREHPQAESLGSGTEQAASCQCRGRRIGQQDGTNRVGDSRSWSSLPSGLRQHPATGANDLVR